MAGGVGVFSPKGGAKGVDVAKGLGKQFSLQLTADGQAGLLAKEILAEVDAAPFIARGAIGGQGGDPEQLTGPFAITGVMIGVWTYRKLRSLKNWWIAWASFERSRNTAPKVLDRGRRWAMLRRYSKLCRFFCSG
jgi:hypothetical protein